MKDPPPQGTTNEKTELKLTRYQNYGWRGNERIETHRNNKQQTEM